MAILMTVICVIILNWLINPAGYAAVTVGASIAFFVFWIALFEEWK